MMYILRPAVILAEITVILLIFLICCIAVAITYTLEKWEDGHGD